MFAKVYFPHRYFTTVYFPGLGENVKSLDMKLYIDESFVLKSIINNAFELKVISK